jgi:hypothetical protein
VSMADTWKRLGRNVTDNPGDVVIMVLPGGASVRIAVSDGRGMVSDLAPADMVLEAARMIREERRAKRG